MSPLHSRSKYCVVYRMQLYYIHDADQTLNWQVLKAFKLFFSVQRIRITVAADLLYRTFTRA